MLKVASLLDRIPFPEVPHGEEGLIETLWLLLTSVIAVPLVCKLPGGSPVLGFLVRICIHRSIGHAFADNADSGCRRLREGF